MRCTALARALCQARTAYFVLDPDGGYWQPRLDALGIECCLGDPPSDLLERCVGVVVDDYDFAPQDAGEWAGLDAPIAFIDDFGQDVPAADLIVSPGMGNYFSGDPGCVRLQGTDYALLAPEFADVPADREISDCNRVLITYGLVDSRNYTGATLEALAESGFKGEVTVAIGSRAPHLDEVRERASALPMQTTVLEDTGRMRELLLECDLAFGSGGVNLLERMACACPSITVITADNQRAQSEWAAALGATMNASVDGTPGTRALASCFLKLARNEHLRAGQAAAGRSVVDGKGAARVAHALMELEAGQVTRR